MRGSIQKVVNAGISMVCAPTIPWMFLIPPTYRALNGKSGEW